MHFGYAFTPEGKIKVRFIEQGEHPIEIFLTPLELIDLRRTLVDAAYDYYQNTGRTLDDPECK